MSLAPRAGHFATFSPTDYGHAHRLVLLQFVAQFFIFV